MPSAPKLIQPSVVQATIGLPRERLLQLRALAEKRNTTIVGLLEERIAQGIEDGDLPDELDGFAVERGDFGRVHITVRGTAFPFVGRQMAEAIANVLQAVAGQPVEQSQAGPGFEAKPYALVPFRLDEDLDFPAKMGLARHGKAVLLSFFDERDESVMKTSFTPSMALDLARQIRKAAAGH